MEEDILTAINLDDGTNLTSNDRFGIPFVHETPSGNSIVCSKDKLVFNDHGVVVFYNASQDPSGRYTKNKAKRLTAPTYEDLQCHYSLIGLFLKSLYKHGRLTDMEIKVENQTFYAHKVVLVCRSEFFANIFRRKTRSAALKVQQVKLENMNPDAVRIILEYFYSGKLEANANNVSQVEQAARKLGVKEAIECCEHIQREMTSPDSVIPLYARSSKEGPEELHIKTSDLISQDFKSNTSCKSFLDMSISEVCSLLSDSMIKVDSEVEIFGAAFRWLQHDYETRLPNLAVLMKCVRFSAMLTEQMFQCLEVAPFLMDHPITRDQILSAHWYKTCQVLQHPSKASFLQMMLPERKDGTISLSDSAKFEIPPKGGTARTATTYVDKMKEIVVNDGGGKVTSVTPVSTKAPIGAPYTALRPTSRNEVIAILGGINPDVRDPSEAGRHFWTYDPCNNAWKRKGNMPEALAYHAVTSLNSCMYVAGGIRIINGQTTNFEPVQMAFEYNSMTDTWRTIAPMIYRRMHHELVPYKDKIYAIGGQNEKGRMVAPVEHFSPATNSWEEITDLPNPRIGIAAAVYRGKIYCVGGLGEPLPNGTVPILSHVEALNPLINRWEVMKPLDTCRCWASLCEAEGNLYLVGGSSKVCGDKPAAVDNLDTIDIYKELEDRWEYKTSMSRARWRSLAKSIDDRIFVFGGTAQEASNTIELDVECYDVETDNWLKDVARLPEPAIGMKACMHRVQPNQPVK